MFIFDMELFKFLTDQCFNFLENFHIILGDKSHGLSCLASSGRTANSMHIIFRIGGDVKIDYDIN